MPYASREDQRAASKEHYLRKRETYNPQRRLLRHDGDDLLRALLSESHSRWVSPDEIRSRINALAGGRKRLPNMLWSRFESRHPAIHLVGLFMGSVPFANNDELLQRLLDCLPKFPKDNAKVELQILKLTLKEMTNGR